MKQLLADEATDKFARKRNTSHSFLDTLTHKQWRILNSYLKISIIVVLVCVAVSWRMKNQAIALDEILPETLPDPIQTPTQKKPFILKFANRDYNIEPLAEYFITGLVVSHNDISSITNSYAQSDDVNVRDICIIWGDNIRTDVFQKMKFSSGSWTCHARFKSGTNHDDWNNFRGNQLSNNHILTPDLALRDLLYTVHPGDQIKMKGSLINYAPTDGSWGGSKRRSSLIREDDGNGACEVFYVEALSILKRGNPVSYMIYSWSKFILPLLLFMKVIAYFVTPLSACLREE